MVVRIDMGIDEPNIKRLNKNELVQMIEQMDENIASKVFDYSIEKSLVNEFENITTVVDDYDLQLLELGFQKIQRRFARWARKYPKSMVYQALIEGEMWKNYKGLSKKDCEKINDILVKSILEGKYTKPELVAKRIEKEVRLPYNRALLIAKTELANMANKARELAYKSMTKVQKFVWITERDSKVCEKCKEVARRSQNGVSLEELKRIIKEVAPDTARELLVHPGCRCSVYRYYPDKRYVRWWEKADVPPERRIYIKPEEVSAYQQEGIRVYRGVKGGYYIDKEELRQKKGTEAERQIERRSELVQRAVTNLVRRVERLGLRDKLESELKNVFEGNEEEAFESYFKVRGIFRKLKKSGAVDRREYNGLTTGLREIYRRRFGYLPGVKAMNEVISQEKEEVERKPREINIKEFVRNVKEMSYMDWIAEYKEMSSLIRKVGGNDAKILSNVLDVVDKSFGGKLYFNEGDAWVVLSGLYIFKKYAESLKDRKLKKEFEKRLNAMLRLMGLDLSQLDYMADKVLVLDEKKVLDIINEIKVDNVIARFGNESVYQLNKFVNVIKSIMGKYGLPISGKVYYPYTNLRIMIMRNINFAGLEDEVLDDLVEGSLEILDDNDFEEYIGEYQNVLTRIDRVFGLRIMDDVRSAFRDIGKIRPYLKLFNRNNAKDINIDDFGINAKQFVKLSNIIKAYGDKEDVLGNKIMTFQNYAERYGEDRYIDEIVERKLGVAVGMVFRMAKFFEHVGFDRKTAMALAKGWEVMRSWTLSDFKKYTGHIEEYVHRIRGNSRPKRAKQSIEKESFKKLFEATAPEEVSLYRKFTEDFVSGYYGDEVKVYRGVSDFEFIQIVRAMFKQKTRNVKLKATLVSTSLAVDIAEEFASCNTIIRAKIRPEQVWGGWWNASPAYEHEEEFIVEFPEEGMDVELVRTLEDFEEAYDLYAYVFEEGALIYNSSEWEHYVYATADGFNLIGEKVLKSLEMVKNKEIFKPIVKDIVDVWSDIYDKMVESLRNLEGVSEDSKDRFFTRFEAILIDLNGEFGDIEGVKEFYEKVKKDKKEFLGG